LHVRTQEYQLLSGNVSVYDKEENCVRISLTHIPNMSTHVRAAYA